MDERDNHVMVPSFISVSLRFEYGFIALSFGQKRWSPMNGPTT